MSSEWRVATVEDIAAPYPTALATGPFGSAISSKYFLDSGVPVIRGSNLSADVSTRLIDDGLVFVSPEKAGEFQRSVVNRGDLVFTCWGTINQVGLIDSRSKFASVVFRSVWNLSLSSPE
jgi:type I restriction enzyme S subunit